MRSTPSAVTPAVLSGLGLSGYDLPTRDKIPVIRKLMAAEGVGLALDVGAGIGYTTRSVFEDRPTVCVDLHEPNLRYYRERVCSVPGASPPRCVVACATALPFRSGVFRYVLCSEVLEHIEDDGAATAELARVLASDGRGVITVPYTGLGVTSFLEILRIKTVHDFPGPEHHVRPGYDERSLGHLLGAHGLELDRHEYYLRVFTRLVTDLVSLSHLFYERVLRGRRAWSWSDVATEEQSSVFRLYARIWPVLWTICRLDGLLRSRRGFGLVAAFRRRALPLG